MGEFASKTRQFIGGNVAISRAFRPEIPASMVREFNLFDDPIFSDNLHDGISRLAAEGRDIFWSPSNGGHWVIVGRKAALAASTDYGLFSVTTPSREGAKAETLMLPGAVDPPLHTAYRQILSKVFSPKAVSSFAPIVQASANELIDRVIDCGGCDFASSVAEPLPVLFFMRLMGLPIDRFMEFRSWVLDGLSEADAGKRQLIWDKVNTVTLELIAERAVRPEDDIISRLVQTKIEGRSLRPMSWKACACCCSSQGSTPLPTRCRS